MKITVLAENTSKNNLPVEHGLSLYIELKDKTILFDTGQSALFSHNAEQLCVDLKKVDILILSHGHYDHGGGIKTFLEINKTAPVYMNKYAFEPHFNGEKYIGLDESIERDRIIFTDGIKKIGDNLTLYSCNDKEKIIDFGSFGLKVLKKDKLVDDDFRHEQYLLIQENGKRILISGCSHKGIINIENWFKPDVLIGGFHFSKIQPGDKLISYSKRLSMYDTDYYTCHCTGEVQYSFMKDYIKRLKYISTGDTIIV